MTNKVYKFGIVGAEMIAEFHAKAIAAITNAELVAVVALREEQALAFAQAHGCQAYTDLTPFVANDGLDVVTICSPSGAHLDPTIAAAEAGKHVICEKPLKVTTERVDRMINACDKAGVMLAGIFPRRFNEATKLFKNAVDNGRFGTIVFADAAIKWWRDQAYYDSGAWRGTWELDGGGALMNQSIHTIDLLLHLMGDVRHVRAQTRLAAHTGIEVEDVGVAMLEFENGAFGTIHGSTSCWSAEGHAAEIQICGSAGSMFMADDKFRTWEFKDERPEDQTILLDHGLNADVAGAGAADPKAIDFAWHQRNFEDALAGLDRGGPPLVDGKEGRRAIALIRAIYESAERGGERVYVA